MRLKEYFSIRCAVGDLPLTLAADPRPTRIEVGVRHDLVHRAHGVHLLGGVLVAEEEDLAGELLADLAGEVRRPEAAVEQPDVGVGLLETRSARRWPASGRRPRAGSCPPPAAQPLYQADHDLGHEPDQPLALQDVQPRQLRPVDGVGRCACLRPCSSLGAVGLVLVPGPAADPLVPAGAERPLAVLPHSGRSRSAARSRRRWTMRACSRTRSSSSTVCGRKALSTSGRSKAIRTVPWARARW